MGWGGIVAQGLIGGAVGIAEGIKGRDEVAQKQQWEIEREKRLSDLRVKEHGEKAQADVDLKVKNAPALGAAEGRAAEAAYNAGGKAVDEGKATVQGDARAKSAAEEARLKDEQKQKALKTPGMRYIEGGAVFEVGADGTPKMITPPAKRELTKLEEDELRSRTAAHNAAARASNARADAEPSKQDAKAASEAAKAKPKFLKQKNSDGEDVLMDENTGWVKEITAATPAKKGSWRLTGPNDPDTPAKPAGIVMKNLETGEELGYEEYLKQKYPKRNLVSAGTTTPPDVKTPAAGGQKFVTGKVYKDGAGNRAKWNGTGWEPL